MKTLISIFLLPLSILSQVIDYNNFDSKRAEVVLFETLQYFRDTIQYTGGGYLEKTVYQGIPDYKSSMKWTWSNDVYNIFSKPNCEKIAKENRLYHNDVKNLVLSEKIQNTFIPVVWKNYMSNFPYTPKVGYSENGVMSTKKYKTYQEMANSMIKTWESSIIHKGTQRKFFSSNMVESNGKNFFTQAACCVRYSNGTFWAFVNIIYAC